MERITTSSTRHCLRGVCRAVAGTSRVSSTFTRRNICLASTTHASSPRTQTSSSFTKPLQTSTHLQPTPRRSYSSTPLGTIAKGADDTALPSSIQNLLAPSHLDEKEKEIFEMLMREFQCTKLDVKDISGGCGSMYGIEVESEKFRGLNMLRQQRLVNGVLKEKMDAEGWHGVQLRTAVPVRS